MKANNNIMLIGSVLVLSTILLASMTIPVGNTKDIFLRVTVEKPICVPLLCSDDTAKIIDVSGFASEHTLFTAPNMASLLSSGKIRIDVDAGSVEKSFKFDETITKGTSREYTMVLSNVPENQDTVTLKLFERNDAKVYVNTDTKTITITEEQE